MAIYHLSVSTISRSAGRSATAAAAYRAGVEIADERTGEVHDYTRKGGVDASAILLPDGAPDWATDRAALWNAAEAAEKRKNSTVGREIIVALPSELSADDRQALAYEMGRALVARHGCAVDVCIHAPGREGDERNHHAHLLLSTRRLTREGFGDKTREWDDRKQGAELVTEWRAEWARLANAALERAGCVERIDHRTLEAQGIERLPSSHQGPAVTGLLRRGQQSDVAERQAAEQAAAAQAKAEAERAAADLAKVQAMLDQAIEAAARDRAEAQRLAALPSRELLAEVRRMDERLPSVAALVHHDPEARQARERAAAAQERADQAQAERAQAKRQEQEWRESRRIRAWLHDKGLMKAGELSEIEAKAAKAGQRLAKLAPAADREQARAQQARQQAEARAVEERRERVERVAKWRELALRKQQAERAAAKELQQAERAAAKQRPDDQEQTPTRERSRGYSR